MNQKKSQLKKVKQTPPPPKSITNPQNNNNSLLGGFIGNMITGFSFGTGSALGHRAVGSVMDKIDNDLEIFSDKNVVKDEKTINNNKCKELKLSLERCISENKDCSELYNDLFKFKCELN